MKIIFYCYNFMAATIIKFYKNKNNTIRVSVYVNNCKSRCKSFAVFGPKFGDEQILLALVRGRI